MDDDDHQRHDEKMRFIEEFALFVEHSGRTPRMAGRILAWLLICNPPHQSMNDLVEALQASKSSVSTMTRLLVQYGLVDRLSLPGDRLTYFRVNAHAWQGLLGQRLMQVLDLRELVERGLELLEDEDDRLRERLEILRDMYMFFESELPALIKRWQVEYQKKWGKGI